MAIKYPNTIVNQVPRNICWVITMIILAHNCSYCINPKHHDFSHYPFHDKDLETCWAKNNMHYFQVRGSQYHRPNLWHSMSMIWTCTEPELRCCWKELYCGNIHNTKTLLLSSFMDPHKQRIPWNDQYVCQFRVFFSNCPLVFVLSFCVMPDNSEI